MPKRYSGDKQPPRAGSSFRMREIKAMNALFSAARRKGDLDVLLRSEDILSVERKFRRMEQVAIPDVDRKPYREPEDD